MRKITILMLLFIITTLAGCDWYYIYKPPIVDGKIHIGFEYGDQLPSEPKLCSIAYKIPYETPIPVDDFEVEFSFGMNYEFYEKEVLEKFTSEFYEDLNNYGRESGYVTPPYKFDEMQFIILVSAEWHFFSGFKLYTGDEELPERRIGFYYDEEDKTDGAAIIKSIPIQEMKKYPYSYEKTKSTTWFGLDFYNYEMTFNHSEKIKIPNELFDEELIDRLEETPIGYSLSILPILAYPEIIDGKTFYRVIDFAQLDSKYRGHYPVGKLCMDVSVISTKTDKNIEFLEGFFLTP